MRWWPNRATIRPAPGCVRDHGRPLDESAKVRRRHELQVDVYERRPVEADQESRLSDVFAGECGEQAADALRELVPQGHHLAVAFILDDNDEIQIGMFVESTVDVGAAGQ